jgi:hypothetical protein
MYMIRRRGYNMSQIKCKSTKSEMLVRKFLFKNDSWDTSHGPEALIYKAVSIEEKSGLNAGFPRLTTWDRCRVKLFPSKKKS